MNGVDTFDLPTTGALLYGAGSAPINADNAMLYCSGTLIGCRTFLTAAHCVSSDTEPSHYAVYLQNAGIVMVSSVTYNSSYTALVGFGLSDYNARDVGIKRYGADTVPW